MTIKDFFYASGPEVNRSVVINLIEQYVKPYIQEGMLPVQKLHQYHIACAQLREAQVDGVSYVELYNLCDGFLVAKMDEFGISEEF
jgi:hypothetical protein